MPDSYFSQRPEASTPDAIRPSKNVARGLVADTHLGGLSARREWFGVLLLLVSIKMIALLLDPQLRVFMGDSESYLQAAMTTWNPPDRSITYPWLLAMAVRAQSGFALVLLQSGLGVASSLCVFWVLRRPASGGVVWAALAAGLVALEPAQLFYERMVMAESAGFLAFMVTLVSAVGYVERGKLRWASCFVLAGLAAVSLRMNFLPVVLGLTMLLPVLRYSFEGVDGQTKWRARGKFALHMAVLAVMTWGTHTTFKHYYGQVMDCEPTYMRSEGQMRLGLVAPLVRPEHLRRVGLSPDLLQRVSFPLSEAWTREAQMWMPGGLWQTLEQEVGHQRAQLLARKIAARALQSDPLGLLRMGLSTTLDYFDSTIAGTRMADDLGARLPSAHAAQMLKTGLRVDQLPQTSVGVGGWFGASRWWLTLVLLLNAPLAAILLWCGRHDGSGRAAMRVVAWATLGLVASHLLFSHIVSFRYLHPMPALFILGAVLLGNCVQSRAIMPRSQRAARAQASQQPTLCTGVAQDA